MFDLLLLRGSSLTECLIRCCCGAPRFAEGILAAANKHAERRIRTFEGTKPIGFFELFLAHLNLFHLTALASPLEINFKQKTQYKKLCKSKLLIYTIA